MSIISEQVSDLDQTDQHIGEVHGIFTIIGVLDKRDKYGHRVYVARCNQCGFEKHSHYGGLSSPSATVTTCKHLRRTGDYIVQYKWNNKRLQIIFTGMIKRCYNNTDKSYCWYGQKGITVYQPWIENPGLFEEWAMCNGYEDTLTIERKDESKGYCPENCEWIPMKMNAKYKTSTSIINVDGEEHTGRDWAIKLGVSVNLINRYIKQYGKDNTIEFIRRFLANPNKIPKYKQSYYDLYMNHN